jgi:hypothetical protein
MRLCNMQLCNLCFFQCRPKFVSWMVTKGSGGLPKQGGPGASSLMGNFYELIGPQKVTKDLRLRDNPCAFPGCR